MFAHIPKINHPNVVVPTAPQVIESNSTNQSTSSSAGESMVSNSRVFYSNNIEPSAKSSSPNLRPTNIHFMIIRYKNGIIQPRIQLLFFLLMLSPKLSKRSFRTLNGLLLWLLLLYKKIIHGLLFLYLQTWFPLATNGFWVKENVDGSTDNYNAKLVVKVLIKGLVFTFFESFSPIIKLVIVEVWKDIMKLQGDIIYN